MSEAIFDDPVVAEIHAVRAKMLADCDGDIERLVRQVAARQQTSGHTIITAPLRKRAEATDTAERATGASLGSPPDR